MSKFLTYVCAVLIAGIVLMNAPLVLAEEQLCWTMDDGWEDASFVLKLGVIDAGNAHYLTMGTLTIKFNTSEPDVVELVNGNAEIVDDQIVIHLAGSGTVTSSTRSELDQETILMRLDPQTFNGTYARKAVLTGTDLALESYTYFDGAATFTDCQ